MPRCEGLPDGPCPKDICNRSVKHTQGDLFLCPSCDAARFPPAPGTDKNTTARAEKDVAIKPKRSSKITKVGKVRPNRGIIINIPLDDEYCPGCNETLDESNSIKCDICNDAYHHDCVGLTPETYDMLLKIISCVGWVCQQCRSEHSGRLNKLQSALTQTHEVMADMRISIARLHDDVEQFRKQSVKSTHTDQPEACVNTKDPTPA